VFINEAVLAGKLKPENILDNYFCGVVEFGGRNRDASNQMTVITCL
jgi:hypothetical protein